MNYLLYVLVITSLFVNSQYLTKEQLLCRKWQQVGMKLYEKTYKKIDGCMAEQIEFRKDGTYSKVIYCSMKFDGQWIFNSDSTKLAIAITELNGTKMANTANINQVKPTTIILHISRDSLIVGNEFYSGSERKYGHDDLYYVPVSQ